MTIIQWAKISKEKENKIMTKKNFVFIDMTCLECGGTMNISEQLKSITIDYHITNGHMEFYSSETSTHPIEIECPYCHKKLLTWTEGIQGQLANRNSVTILGNIKNTKIVIGNNNKV